MQRARGSGWRRCRCAVYAGRAPHSKNARFTCAHTQRRWRPDEHTLLESVEQDTELEREEDAALGLLAQSVRFKRASAMLSAAAPGGDSAGAPAGQGEDWQRQLRLLMSELDAKNRQVAELQAQLETHRAVTPPAATAPQAAAEDAAAAAPAEAGREDTYDMEDRLSNAELQGYNEAAAGEETQAAAEEWQRPLIIPRVQFVPSLHNATETSPAARTKYPARPSSAPSAAAQAGSDACGGLSQDAVSGFRWLVQHHLDVEQVRCHHAA